CLLHGPALHGAFAYAGCDAAARATRRAATNRDPNTDLQPYPHPDPYAPSNSDADADAHATADPYGYARAQPGAGVAAISDCDAHADASCWRFLACLGLAGSRHFVSRRRRGAALGASQSRRIRRRGGRGRTHAGTVPSASFAIVRDFEFG